MGLILKKYPLYLGLFGGFFLTLQALQGTLFQATFKKSLLKKPLKISIATRQFLKDVLPLQQKVLAALLDRSKKSFLPIQKLQACIDISYKILQSGVLKPEDIDQLSDQLIHLKTYVFEIDISRKVDQSYADIGQKNVWNFLMQALPTMQLGGLESDRSYLFPLVTQIGSLQVSSEKIKQHALIVRAIATCNDMLNHFNGLLVNDYDLIVLSQLMISMVLLEA